MRRAVNKLWEELGREPTDEELAEELGTTPASVAEMRSITIQPASLSAPAGDEDGAGTFGEIIEDASMPTPSAELVHKVRLAALNEILNTLDPREAAMVWPPGLRPCRSATC